MKSIPPYMMLGVRNPASVLLDGNVQSCYTTHPGRMQIRVGGAGQGQNRSD